MKTRIYATPAVEGLMLWYGFTKPYLRYKKVHRWEHRLIRSPIQRHTTLLLIGLPIYALGCLPCQSTKPPYRGTLGSPLQGHLGEPTTGAPWGAPYLWGCHLSSQCHHMAAMRPQKNTKHIAIRITLFTHLIECSIWINQSGGNEMNRALGHLCAHIG